MTPPVRRGQDNGAAKLTPEQVDGIRSGVYAHLTKRQTAALHGVTVDTVRLIEQYRTWTHRPPPAPATRPAPIARRRAAYPPRVLLTDAERLERHTPPRGPGCWEWTGNTNNNGYGILTRYSPVTRRPRTVLAHRLAYAVATAIEYEQLLPDVVVRHTCNNPPCIRPGDLIAGTQRDNVADAIERGTMKPLPVVHGEDQWQAKLTDAAVVAIRSGDHAGLTPAAIADLYGVNPATIRDVIQRRTWRHIT